VKHVSSFVALVVTTLTLALPTAANAIPTSAPATAALDWNAAAVTAVRAARVTTELPAGVTSRALYQTEGQLYMSYVQAAVYDAATKIDHRYAPYHHFSAGAGNASIEAAVIAAAYDTLVYYLGDPSGTLAAKYAQSIGALPDDRATARGIAVGEAAAADIEALRAGDGRNATLSTTYGIGSLQAGLWILPPSPAVQIAQTPWLAFMHPFMLESTSQFQAPPPPALTSAQYAGDFNETEAYGSATSAVRTAAQTATGFFWNANVISQMNETLRDFATQHGMDLVDTARLLAMGDMISTDAGMACFRSKYTYLFWRPITAIQHADIDGNAATTADPTWQPVLATPNHPEYPSQHGCVTSALTGVLANIAGSDAINATIFGATTANPTGLVTTRTFATVDGLLSELVDARVYLGFHFRHSVLAGEDLGTQVANWELQRFFLPTGDGD
jgi:hypothetical protein